MKSAYRFVLFCAALSTPLFAALEVNKDNCAAKVVEKHPRLDSVLRQSLEKRLVEKHHKRAPEAVALVNRLERRLVFFEAWEAGELEQFENILGIVGIDDTERDQQLLVADLLESLPASLNPFRIVGANRVLPHLDNHAGLPYLLDILTLPVEAVEDWLEDHEFSLPKPEFSAPVRIHPLESRARSRSRFQAIALAKQMGCKYVMENVNGTFTPLKQQPNVGSYFSVELTDKAPPPSTKLSPEFKYAVIQDVTGDLVFLNRKPIVPASEYFVFGPEGIEGPVIGHGVTGAVELKRIQRDFANVLAEEWEDKRELHNEVTLVHRIVFYTIMERLAVDLTGISNPERLPDGRNYMRAQLQAFLVQHRGRTLVNALHSYLQEHEPYQHIYSHEDLRDMED